jgi:hypothetical protein
MRYFNVVRELIFNAKMVLALLTWKTFKYPSFVCHPYTHSYCLQSFFFQLFYACSMYVYVLKLTCMCKWLKEIYLHVG